MAVLPSLVKFDHGRNREGHWRAHHVVEHLEEFIDILEHVAPAFQHLFIFDNSSGHGAFAPDALVASKMSKGWGGKQPLMRPGYYYTPDSCFRVKQHMVFQEGDDPPVSKYSGRLLPGEAPPPYVGQPKGLHQALFERSKLEGVLTPASKKSPATEANELKRCITGWRKTVVR